VGAARFDKNSSKLQEAADLCWPVADVLQEMDEPLPLPSSSSPAWASKLTPENIERHTRPEPLASWWPGAALCSQGGTAEEEAARARARTRASSVRSAPEVVRMIAEAKRISLIVLGRCGNRRRHSVDNSLNARCVRYRTTGIIQVCFKVEGCLIGATDNPNTPE
jgi:hypothetical protein